MAEQHVFQPERLGSELDHGAVLEFRKADERLIPYDVVKAKKDAIEAARGSLETAPTPIEIATRQTIAITALRKTALEEAA